MLGSRKGRFPVVATGKLSVTFVHERSPRYWPLREECECIKKRQGRRSRISLEEGFSGLTFIGRGLLYILRETQMQSFLGRRPCPGLLFSVPINLPTPYKCRMLECFVIQPPDSPRAALVGKQTFPQWGLCADSGPPRASSHLQVTLISKL